MQTLRVALIGGQQYDTLYSLLPRFEQESGLKVQMEVQLPHPELNAHIADNYNAPTPKVAYDLISTHIKYAPSQQKFLRPLDEYFTAQELTDFLPTALKNCYLEGKLYQIPRNLDMRLLYYRSDLVQTPPQTWNELLEQAASVNNPAAGIYGYVFPGQYSGLFGTFFELAAMAGDPLFGPNFEPIMGAGAEAALEYLRQFYVGGLVPPQLPDWHYDEVSTFFREGHAAFVCDWPAFYGLYLASPVADKFEMAMYPLGASGERHVYAGGHSFAIPSTCQNLDGALALLRYLTSHAAQLLEARQGVFPTRRAVLEQVIAESPVGSPMLRRWQLLQKTASHYMLMFPKSPRYPLVEDSLWPTVQAAILGKVTAAQGVAQMRTQVKEIMNDGR